MRRFVAGSLVVSALLLSLPAVAAAQTGTPARGDVGITYTILNDRDLSETFPFGFAVAPAYHLSEMMSVVGEFGLNSKSINGTRVTVYDYMGGVRFGPETTGGARPFGQVLVGGATASGGGSSTSGFSIQPGAGVDVPFGEALSFRGQFDYRLIRSNGANSSEIRFGFGIAYSFQ